MSAWRPISEAPTSRDLLLWYPAHGAVRGRWNADSYARRPAPYWSHDRERLYGIREARAHPPTHWQDLPAGPEAES